MEIKLAKTAGFCFGVERAVKIAEKAALKGTVYTMGQLIHNRMEVERLEKRGVHVINSAGEVKAGDTVIIRSHGISAELEAELLSRGADIIDATCPFVKKIHNIVSEYYEKGYAIIIAGDPDHPEVRGINGRCGNQALVVSDESELLDKITGIHKACIVSQTTFNRKNWEKIINILKNTCKDMLFFDTICEATNNRQREAEILSAECDTVIVIGDRHSSNTAKLVELCKGKCKNVIHIENSSEFSGLNPLLTGVIGVTAGASAPDWIIKEVLNTMEENIQKGDISFEEELKNSLFTLKTGDIVKGTVIGITPTEIYVDLGYKSDGVISASELTDNSDAKPEDIVKIGDEVEVYVYRVSDLEGTVGLSMKKIESIKGWKTVNDAFENKEDLKGKVVEAVNGGVIVLSEGVRIFVPASQANDRYMSDLTGLVGREVPVRILDIVNRGRKKVVGSIKAVLVDEKSRKTSEFWTKIDAGQTEFKGVVKTLTNFGAFVDIGGIDGLIHISQLSWGHIKHPSEVLSVGQEVAVTVLEANKETNKISLGYRKEEDDPWVIAKNTLHEGDSINVKIVRLVSFGAFAEVIPHIDGLIHVSEIANERIDKPSDVLSVGQTVEVKITGIDWKAKKVALSIKALLPVEEKAAEEPVVEEAEETVAEDVEEFVEESPAETSEAALAEAVEDNEDAAPTPEIVPSEDAVTEE